MPLGNRIEFTCEISFFFFFGSVLVCCAALQTIAN